MARKTVKKQAVKNPRAAIVTAALDLAAKGPWADVTLTRIARKAKVSLSELHGICADKTDILVLLGREIDQTVIKAMENSEGDNAKDRLFEVMMERFDALQSYRDGLVSILDSFIYDPKQALISLPHLCRSMNWMLELSGVDTNGPKGAAKILGLTVIYLKVLKDWKDDESEDLSRTMAALDKALSQAEMVVNRFGL